MPRFSVSLSDDDDEWVEREAEARDRSKSQIVAAAVEAARKGDVDPFGDGERDAADPDRLDRLEQRVAELERHVDTSTGGGESPSGEERHTGAESAPNTPPDEPPASGGDRTTDDSRPAGADDTDTDGADVHPEVREAVDRAAEWWGDDGRLDDRREAALAVLDAVRESDAGLTKTDILERFADEYAVEGQSEGTWWRRNLAEGAEYPEAPAPLKLVATYSRGTHKWRWVGLDDPRADENADE